jgi:hypothetical protein
MSGPVRRWMRPRLAAWAVGLLVVFLISATDTATAEILPPGSATELAADVGEAASVQGVCYGWVVTVDDQENKRKTRETGSNLGAGVDARADRSHCPKYVVFLASMTYTSNGSEAEDSATFSVDSTVPNTPAAVDLHRIGITEGGLLGDQDEETVVWAVSALPELTAEKAGVPHLTLEPDAQVPEAGDQPTGSPGSDNIRRYLGWIIVLVLVAVAAAVWTGYAGYAWYRDPGRRSPSPAPDRNEKAGP